MFGVLGPKSLTGNLLFLNFIVEDLSAKSLYFISNLGHLEVIRYHL